MSISLKLDDAEFLAALKALEKRAGKATARRAVRAAATVVAREAREIVPVESGELKRSIKVRTRVRRYYADGIVGATAPHAHLVELGTDPHRIPRKGMFKKAIRHPGARPHPFLRPAFDRKHGEAVRKMAEVLRAAITKGVSA